MRVSFSSSSTTKQARAQASKQGRQGKERSNDGEPGSRTVRRAAAQRLCAAYTIIFYAFEEGYCVLRDTPVLVRGGTSHLSQFQGFSSQSPQRLMPHNVDLASTKEERKQDLSIFGKQGNNLEQGPKAPAHPYTSILITAQDAPHAPLPRAHVLFCAFSAALPCCCIPRHATPHHTTTIDWSLLPEYKTTFIKKVRGRIEERERERERWVVGYDA